jgi:hypothetical protein
MPQLMRHLIAAALLLSLTGAACGQAGRYVPMPARPPSGMPGYHPSVPYLFHDSGFENFLLVIGCLCLAGWLGWVVGYALACKRAPGSARHASGSGVSASDLIHSPSDVAPKAERTRRLMEVLARRDALFDPPTLRRWVEQRFLDVQDCWQKADYGPLDDALLPALRAEHEGQLAAMRANGERNVLRDLAVERLEFVHLDCPSDPDQQEFTALITFRAASYYVGALSGAFRRGSRVPTLFQEFWVFHRKDNAWQLAAIERSHVSTRLAYPNHVEGLTEEQQQNAEQCVAP